MRSAVTTTRTVLVYAPLLRAPSRRARGHLPGRLRQPPPSAQHFSARTFRPPLPLAPPPGLPPPPGFAAVAATFVAGRGSRHSPPVTCQLAPSDRRRSRLPGWPGQSPSSVSALPSSHVPGRLPGWPRQSAPSGRHLPAGTFWPAPSGGHFSPRLLTRRLPTGRGGRRLLARHLPVRYPSLPARQPPPPWGDDYAGGVEAAAWSTASLACAVTATSLPAQQSPSFLPVAAVSSIDLDELRPCISHNSSRLLPAGEACLESKNGTALVGASRHSGCVDIGAGVAAKLHRLGLVARWVWVARWVGWRVGSGLARWVG